MPILYHTEPPLIFQFPYPEPITDWISYIINDLGKKTGEINYIFCTDEYLLKINTEYLNHHYYTDIITFDNSDDTEVIESDMFISYERVKENAEKLNVSTENELYRVMIHGVLHLLGFKDKTDTEQQEMRQKENECLQLLQKKHNF